VSIFFRLDAPMCVNVATQEKNHHRGQKPSDMQEHLVAPGPD